jgi:hypothetical protein
MKKLILLLCGLVLALYTTSCELNGGSSSDSNNNNDVPVIADDLDISQAVTLGQHKIPAQNAALTRQMHHANKHGGHVSMSFDTLNWPSRAAIDGGVYIYWQEGSRVVGGLFDFHRTGQTHKTLENIYGGYLSGKQPSRGTAVYFCIVSSDGSERTSVKLSTNPW